MGNKTSIIWSSSREEFQKLYDDNSSIHAILKTFGLSHQGSNCSTLKKRAIEENICLQKHNKNRSEVNPDLTKKFASLAELLIDHRLSEKQPCPRKKIDHVKKKLLIEGGFLKNECSKCKIRPEWFGEKLVLQIDHINGVPKDNRLENLRFLCPNCHSQTSTYAGRNRKKSEKAKKAKLYKGRNGPRLGARKIDRPSKEELAILLWEKPTVSIAADYGVSDVAVGKWAKRYGIEKPPRGYWGFVDATGKLGA